MSDLHEIYFSTLEWTAQKLIPETLYLLIGLFEIWENLCKCFRGVLKFRQFELSNCRQKIIDNEAVREISHFFWGLFFPN